MVNGNNRLCIGMRCNCKICKEFLFSIDVEEDEIENSNFSFRSPIGELRTLQWRWDKVDQIFCLEKTKTYKNQLNDIFQKSKFQVDFRWKLEPK